MKLVVSHGHIREGCVLFPSGGRLPSLDCIRLMFGKVGPSKKAGARLESLRVRWISKRFGCFFLMVGEFLYGVK